jgi:hypothetical protein
MQTKQRTRVKFKPYFSPTPKRIRIFGDSLAAASIMVAGFNMNEPRVMIACAIVGGLGKFVSNFFTVEKDEE